MSVESVFIYALRKHVGQWYGDKPYSYHLESVSNLTEEFYFKDKDYSLLSDLAWSHDLVEDCEDVTLELLREKNWPLELVEAIDAITKRQSESREDYLVRCMKNPHAKKIKVVDTLSNLTESLKEGDQRRILKYTKQLQKLHDLEV